MIRSETRRTVRTIYAFACGYCGVTEIEVGSQLTIDHFQPLDSGGTDDIENLVYACHACNLYKSAAWNATDPVALHPLRNEMSVHLRLLPNATFQGLTQQGLRHIDALHLNRAPLVAHRSQRQLSERLLRLEEQILDRTRNEQRLAEKKRREIWSKKRG